MENPCLAAQALVNGQAESLALGDRNHRYHQSFRFIVRRICVLQYGVQHRTPNN
jgi:hypothetical protein